MATKKPIIKKAVAKKPAIKKPIVKKAVVKKPIVSKMKKGGKVKKAQTGITTSTSYDPETKETTVKKSWSNTRSGSLNSSASAKPSSTRNTNVSSKPAPTAPRPITKPTVSKTPISATTKGERKIVSFPSPTPAKAVGMEPKAGVDLKKRAPSDPRYVNKLKLEAKAKMDLQQRDEYLAKEYPNLSREKAIDKYYRIKERVKNQQEREFNRDQRRNLPAPNKRGSGGCRTC